MIFSKLDEETYESLLSVLGYLQDGRIFRARAKLEEILGLNTDSVA